MQTEPDFCADFCTMLLSDVEYKGVNPHNKGS